MTIGSLIRCTHPRVYSASLVPPGRTSGSGASPSSFLAHDISVEIRSRISVLKFVNSIIEVTDGET